VGHSPLVRNRDLAVQDGAAHGQVGEEFGNYPEPARRVISGPGLETDPAVLDVGDDAVPVVFNLVHPTGARWRLRRGAHELRGDARRHGPAAGEESAGNHEGPVEDVLGARLSEPEMFEKPVSWPRLCNPATNPRRDQMTLPRSPLAFVAVTVVNATVVPGVWGLYSLLRTGRGASSLTSGDQASYVSRVVAFYRHLAGIPTDQSPPVVGVSR
jgi:hypothetical protein